MEKVNKHSLLSKAELSVWLDTYDDIFSDFDSRPFTERAVSDDFIAEVQKMVREKPEGGVELRLLMPEKLRKPETEAIIVKNLHTHFRKVVKDVESEIKKAVIRGIILSLIGFTCMISAAFIASLYTPPFYITALKVMLEPAGWFMLWAGLESIFYERRRKNTQLIFSSKMAKSEISFLSI